MGKDVLRKMIGVLPDKTVKEAGRSFFAGTVKDTGELIEICKKMIRNKGVRPSDVIVGILPDNSLAGAVIGGKRGIAVDIKEIKEIY